MARAEGGGPPPKHGLILRFVQSLLELVGQSIDLIQEGVELVPQSSEFLRQRSDLLNQVLLRHVCHRYLLSLRRVPPYYSLADTTGKRLLSRAAPRYDPPSGGRIAMRALVTGGTGFIGSSIIRVLLEAGYAVRALIRRGADTRNLDSLDLEIVQGDITDINSLRRAICGCELLFHAGALYSFWTREPGLIYKVNVEGTQNALKVAQEAGLERVVYTSSVAALAVPKGKTPVNEETPVDPQKIIGDYKRSKYLAEQVALEYAREDLPVVIVNPTFPVGPRDIKPTPTGRTILDFLNRNLPAYVETGMNVVDVEDVAVGHLLVAEKGRIGERYILGGENMTMGEMLRILSEITGIPAPRVKLPYYPVLGLSYLNAALCRITGTTPRMTPETIRMSRHYMYYDSGKAIRELDLPQTSARVALGKAVAWFRENGYVRIRGSDLDS